jgi:hypothetical protein
MNVPAECGDRASVKGRKRRLVETAHAYSADALDSLRCSSDGRRCICFDSR